MNINKWLEDNDWVECPINSIDSACRKWAKQIDCSVVCQLNDVLCTHLLEYDLEKVSPGLGTQYSVEIHAQPLDGTWVKLTAHGLNADELEDMLDSQVTKLVAGWTAMNRTPRLDPAHCKGEPLSEQIIRERR